MRLLIVGFDGLSPELVARWPELVPRIASLPGKGTVTSSVVLTWPAWTSMATGLLPDRHGVKTALADEQTGRPWRRQDVRAQRFLWQLLNEYGYSIGWYRLPVTSYPPCAVDGWMASGGASAPTAIWPQECAEAYHPGPASLWEFQGVPLQAECPESVEEQCRTLWRRARQALDAELTSLLRLLSSFPVDVIFCYFNYTDTVQHHCYHNEDIMQELYLWVNTAWEALFDAAVPDDAILVSDHGMRRAADEQGRMRWESPDEELCWIGDIPFVRSEKADHAYYQSGVHAPQGILRTTFRLSGDLRVEDVFALATMRCGIPVEELEGLDCTATCCKPGPPADQIQRQLRALGYL